jgi:hypothetical protein
VAALVSADTPRKSSARACVGVAIDKPNAPRAKTADISRERILHLFLFNTARRPTLQKSVVQKGYHFAHTPFSLRKGSQNRVQPFDSVRSLHFDTQERTIYSDALRVARMHGVESGELARGGISQ